MNTNHTRQTADSAVTRRYNYEDRWVVAFDLGVTDDVSVDTVGATAIVVLQQDGESAESEFDLPGPADDISVQNGVVTIEGSR